MVNTVPMTIGFLLIIGAVAGYMIPMSVTLGDTTVNLTIPKVVAFCDSGFGQMSQMLAQVVMVCSEFKNFMMGIYGAGIGGLILIIVGAILPGEKKEAETRKEWICEHCKFKTKAEVDLIEHYKLDHADKKGDSYHRKYDKKPLSAETLEILKQRYAKGEISKEEFENMKKDLENS